MEGPVLQTEPLLNLASTSLFAYDEDRRPKQTLGSLTTSLSYDCWGCIVDFKLLIACINDHMARWLWKESRVSSLFNYLSNKRQKVIRSNA